MPRLLSGPLLTCADLGQIPSFTVPSGPLCVYVAEVVESNISPFGTFGHLVSRAVRAHTQSGHGSLAPIGAVLRRENRVVAANVAAPLCC